MKDCGERGNDDGRYVRKLLSLVPTPPEMKYNHVINAFQK